MAGERQLSTRNRFADPCYQFPCHGWCWLSQLLKRDDKTCRASMLAHIRKHKIEVKRFPNDYLVNIEDFVSKTPSD